MARAALRAILQASAPSLRATLATSFARSTEAPEASREASQGREMLRACASLLKCQGGIKMTFRKGL